MLSYLSPVHQEVDASFGLVSSLSSFRSVLKPHEMAVLKHAESRLLINT